MTDRGTIQARLGRGFDPEELRRIKRLWVRHSIAENRRDIDGLIATLSPDCTYEIVVKDTQSDPKQSVPVAQKFVNDKRIVAEIGDFASPASMSSRIASRPAMIASASAVGMMSCVPSMRACAMEPAMSSR